MIRVVRGFSYPNNHHQPPLIGNFRDDQLIRATEDVVFRYHVIDPCHAFLKLKQRRLLVWNVLGPHIVLAFKWLLGLVCTHLALN